MSNFSSPIQVTPQNVYAGSTTQGISVGSYAETNDGRGFRYVAVGTLALIPGKVYQGPAEDTTNYQYLGVAATTATGAVVVTIASSTTIAANALAGGLATVAGTGYSYKIAANTATSSATGCVITLEDPLQVTLTTASQLNCSPNPYNGVIVAPTTLTSAPIGIAVAPVAAASYGWIQTRGLVGALVDASAPAMAQSVAPSAATSGAVKLAVGTQAAIGYMAQTGTSAKYCNVFLEID